MLAYRLAGMTWFDAIMPCLPTMGLGGFSTPRRELSATSNSPLIEAVAIVFMLIAGINFATHFLAWRDAQLRGPIGATPRPACSC